MKNQKSFVNELLLIVLILCFFAPKASAKEALKITLMVSSGTQSLQS